MDYSFKKMDAFAKKGSAGNPAGAVYPEKDQTIDSATMQRIASELRFFVSEVGFVFPLRPESGRIDGPAYRLKYYSSEREVDFCGHATIAIMYDLFVSGKAGLAESIRILTNRGELDVYNRLADSDSVFISAPVPKFIQKEISRIDTACSLGITEKGLADFLPIRIINAGLTTLLVPVAGLEVILNLKPDFDVLKKWCLECEVDIVEVFCRETIASESSWRVRVFCPRMGYLEDPATGSGNSAFGYYLLEERLWKGEPLILEQNAEKERYNIIRLATLDSGKRVIFGGGAQVKINGTYSI